MSIKCAENYSITATVVVVLFVCCFLCVVCFPFSFLVVVFFSFFTLRVLLSLSPPLSLSLSPLSLSPFLLVHIDSTGIRDENSRVRETGRWGWGGGANRGREGGRAILLVLSERDRQGGGGGGIISAVRRTEGERGGSDC